MFSLFKKEKINYLLNNKPCNANYLLKVKSDLFLGEEKQRVAFEINSKINIEHYSKDENWYTAINLLFVCGEASLPSMNEFVQEALVLANITSCLVFKRKSSGQIDKLMNNEQIKRNWIQWKNKKLPGFISDEVKQKKFIQNYEGGLNNIDQIKNNFTYSLLMPPFYEIPHFPNGSWKIPNVATWKARFINDLSANYDYIVKQDNGYEITNLIYQASNLRNLNSSLSVRNFYQNNLSNHNSETYKVDISGDYRIEKETGKILEGSLYHVETLNNNFIYRLSHELKMVE